MNEERLNEIRELVKVGPDGRLMGGWDGDSRATALTEVLAELLSERAELEEQLETLRRHDEAATQDAVFFRKQLVDTQEQLDALQGFVTRLVNEEQDTNAWCDIYDVLHERYSSESIPASEPKP